jgi:hypothetical protein
MRESWKIRSSVLIALLTNPCFHDTLKVLPQKETPAFQPAFQQYV